jgi:hypothetical protein
MKTTVKLIHVSMVNVLIELMDFTVSAMSSSKETDVQRVS